MLVWLLLTACSLEQSEVAPICQQAQKGDKQARLVVVSHYGEFFQECISPDTFQAYCSQLMEQGEYLAYKVAISIETSKDLKEKLLRLQQEGKKRVTPQELNDLRKAAKDSATLRLGRVSMEHGCLELYDDVARIYRNRFKTTHDPADSIAAAYYKHADRTAALHILPGERSVIGAVKGSLRAVRHEMSANHDGSLLHRATESLSMMTMPFVVLVPELLLEKATWWQALLAIVVFFALVYGLLKLLGMFAGRHDGGYEEMGVTSVYAFYNVLLQAIVLSSANTHLWAVPLKWSIGSLTYPAASFGCAPYFALVPTWITAVILLCLVGSTIKHMVGGGASGRQIAQCVAHALLVFLFSYLLMSFVGMSLLYALGGLIAIIVIIFLCLLAIGAAFGAIGGVLGGMFTLPLQQHSSRGSSSGYSSYGGGSADSSSSSGGDTTQGYDVTISHGGTFGEDIQARRNVDGSLTDRSGGHWSNDGYGNYSRDDD